MYELTDWGRELEPVVLGLGRWGSRVAMPPGDPKLGVDSAMLALKTLFDAHAADGLEASYELRFGEQRFHARVADGRFTIARGDADQPDAMLDTDPNTLATLLWEGRRLTDALRSGDVKIEGSRPAVTRFLGLFPLPV